MIEYRHEVIMDSLYAICISVMVYCFIDVIAWICFFFWYWYCYTVCLFINTKCGALQYSLINCSVKLT